MTDNIRAIFERNIQLLKSLDRANYYFRIQAYDKALGIIADSAELINTAVDAILRDREYFHLVSTDTVLEMLSGILSSQKARNYILLADLLELQLTSFLCSVQELIISKEEIEFDETMYEANTGLLKEKGIGFEVADLEELRASLLLENGYRIEFTSTGLMTLAAMNNEAEFYFHTNNRVYTEGLQLAGAWYQKEAKSYIIYGFGMGYHIEELLNIAKTSTIEVYEADINVIKLTCAFRNLKELLCNEGLKLIYDPALTKLEQRLREQKENEVFKIHYPSYQNIRNQECPEILEKFIPWSKTLEGR